MACPAQLCLNTGGWYPMFTFLDWDSLSMLCLVTTVLFFNGVALGCFANGEELGLEGQDLWVKGLAMVWHP